MSDLNVLEQQLQAASSSCVDLVAEIRPQLHRYCSRMTGSIIDGEDMVQEVLAQAFFKLSQIREGLPLRPWLFRIAHTRCIDFLRAQIAPSEFFDEFADEAAYGPSLEGAMAAKNPVSDLEVAQQAGAALALLLERMPPKERSYLLLKDMMGYSLSEISALTATSEGAVKSALHRARGKLTEAPTLATVQVKANPSPLLAKYIAHFNAQDWDGVTEVLEADARLNVVGIFEGEGKQTVRNTYMRNYTEALYPWWFEVVEIDGREASLCWQDQDGVWSPRSLCLMKWSANGLGSAIRDYRHATYMLDEVVLPPSPHQRGLLGAPRPKPGDKK